VALHLNVAATAAASLPRPARLGLALGSLISGATSALGGSWSRHDLGLLLLTCQLLLLLLQYTWPEFIGADLSKVTLMDALSNSSWDSTRR
jgi:hypothetical protein